MEKIEGVVLDADGPLLASFPHAKRYYPKVAKKLGLKTDMKIFRSCWALPYIELLQAIWPGINRNDFDRVYQDLGFDKIVIPQIRGASKTLLWLKNNISFMGLITSRQRESLGIRLEQAGIDPRQFDFMQALEDCIIDGHLVYKPDPRVFDRALELADKKGIAKKNIIYVGDDLRDFQAASGAGLGGFVGVLTGAATKKQFIAAGLSEENIIKSIRKLPRWLERSGRLGG